MKYALGFFLALSLSPVLTLKNFEIVYVAPWAQTTASITVAINHGLQIAERIKKSRS